MILTSVIFLVPYKNEEKHIRNISDGKRPFKDNSVVIDDLVTLTEQALAWIYPDVHRADVHKADVYKADVYKADHMQKAIDVVAYLQQVTMADERKDLVSFRTSHDVEDRIHFYSVNQQYLMWSQLEIDEKGAYITTGPILGA